MREGPPRNRCSTQKSEHIDIDLRSLVDIIKSYDIGCMEMMTEKRVKASTQTDLRTTQAHAPNSGPVILHHWRELADSHRTRVRKWTEPYRNRRAHHETHPVYDFLFQYYRLSPAQLEEWHPALGEAIPLDSLNEDDQLRFAPPCYRIEDGRIQHDLSAMSRKERERIRWIRNLLQRVSTRRGHFSCYGIHEWAMVYSGGDVRHREAAPLRLSQSEIDEVVEDRPIACTHFDAFRFFSPDAKPLNRVQPELLRREELEQPGCVHANMDLYKWAYKSLPWVGSEIVWKTFSLALELRTLDMRASPYDLAELGFEPICIESSEGRAEYQQLQRTLSERAQMLRGELIGLIDSIAQA